MLLTLTAITCHAPIINAASFTRPLDRGSFSSAHSSARKPAIAASAKTIAFGDFSYYWIADRQGRSFKRLNERFAETGQIGFIASKRLDGKLILPEAIKVLQQKGTASSGG